MPPKSNKTERVHDYTEPPYRFIAARGSSLELAIAQLDEVSGVVERLIEVELQRVLPEWAKPGWVSSQISVGHRIEQSE